MARARIGVFIALATAGAGCGETTEHTRATLGEALFQDPILSKNQTQSCATCHDPERGFADARADDQGRVRAVSLGDDGVSLGDRNAPTISYAVFAPEFHIGRRQRFNKQNSHRMYQGALGGFFWDGRRPDLEGQAGDPPLNRLEMGMPDQATVVARLADDERYAEPFRALFGEDVFDDPAIGYSALRESIAAFERTPAVSPFDSKYDRFLRGEVALSFKELTGKSLFFSEFSSCPICHQLNGNGDPLGKFEETFTGYEFHNIGVPVNTAVRSMNGVTELDPGLLANPEISNPEERGKFKTPTLRNIAVTGPYMHNGVFASLRAVIEFYDHFVNEERVKDPDTGEPWGEPEIPETVARELLETADEMTDADVEAMVCFLRMLTDARYEALIPDDGIVCAD